MSKKNKVNFFGELINTDFSSIVDSQYIAQIGELKHDIMAILQQQPLTQECLPVLNIKLSALILLIHQGYKSKKITPGLYHCFHTFGLEEIQSARIHGINARHKSDKTIQPQRSS